MVRPDDLDKLFSTGLPTWIEKTTEEQKPVTEKKPTLKQVFKGPTPAIAGHTPISAQLGVYGRARMYTFFKEDSAARVSQAGQPYTDLASVDDMIPLGKHHKVQSKPVAKGLWYAQGNLVPGTVLKVFVGYTDEPTYGMYFYSVDEYTPEIIIEHIEGRLFLQGKLRPLDEGMYSELGIRKPPAKSKGVPVRIVEV